MGQAAAIARRSRSIKAAYLCSDEVLREISANQSKSILRSPINSSIGGMSSPSIPGTGFKRTRFSQKLPGVSGFVHCSGSPSTVISRQASRSIHPLDMYCLLGTLNLRVIWLYTPNETSYRTVWESHMRLHHISAGNPRSVIDSSSRVNGVSFLKAAISTIFGSPSYR